MNTTLMLAILTIGQTPDVSREVFIMVGPTIMNRITEDEPFRLATIERIRTMGRGSINMDELNLAEKISLDFLTIEPHKPKPVTEPSKQATQPSKQWFWANYNGCNVRIYGWVDEKTGQIYFNPQEQTEGGK